MEEDLFGELSEEEMEMSSQSEPEEEFEVDVSEEEPELEEAEEEEQKRFAREMELSLEEEIPEEEEKETVEIPKAKKEEEEGEELHEEQVRREQEKWRRLGYDVKVIPVGVGVNPEETKKKKSAQTGRLAYTKAERKKYGIPSPELKKGKVIEERVSTKKAKLTAKRRKGIKIMVEKPEFTKYGARRIGTTRLVGTHLEEPVDVYEIVEKPYDRFLDLLKRWEERYEDVYTEVEERKDVLFTGKKIRKLVGKPAPRSSVPVISRVLKDVKKSKMKRVYDVPITYRDIAILKKRPKELTKILREVKNQHQEVIRELEEAQGLSGVERQKRLSEIAELEKQIFDAAEEAREEVAPRTEAGAYLVRKLDEISRAREDAEELEDEEREKVLDELDKKERKAREKASKMRVELAKTMGIVPGKRQVMIVEGVPKRTGKRIRSPLPKKSAFQYKAWRASKRPDSTTRQNVVKLLGDKELEVFINSASSDSRAYLRRVGLLRLILSPKSKIRKRIDIKNFTKEELARLSERELLPEFFIGGDSAKFSEFLRRYTEELTETFFKIKEGQTTIQEFSLLSLGEELELPKKIRDSGYMVWSKRKRPDEETRKALRSVFSKALEDLKIKKEIKELEENVFVATKTARGYNLSGYLRRFAILSVLLSSKDMRKKSPFLTKKLESGFYRLSALGLVSEEELAPEFLLKTKSDSFEEFMDEYQDEFSKLVFDVRIGERKPKAFSSLPKPKGLETPPKLQTKCVNPDASDIPLGNIVMCYTEGVFYCFDVEDDIKNFIRTGKFKNPYTKRMLPFDFIEKMKQRYS